MYIILQRLVIFLTQLSGRGFYPYYPLWSAPYLSEKTL